MWRYGRSARLGGPRPISSTGSPHDHDVIYTGSQYVHRTTDGGQSWQVISPDLTLNDKSRQQMSGGLTGDNIGVEYAGVVFAIAESPVTAGLIWVGTNDGLVQVTQDGGGTWTNVTKNIPNLPPWGTVSNIEPSRYDASTAYLTVDFHQVNGRDPYVYKTTDLGKSWKLIVNGIPKSPLSYAHVVREDPVRRGMLYLGTENALYVSFDDGNGWQPLQANLPHAPVYWLTVQEQFHDLVVATYGRGFWILDDITPLEQLTPDIAAREVHLFQPRDAYRFRAIQGPAGIGEDPTAGVDPPYGASITYWLTSVPTGDVKLVILDAAGDTVRTLQATNDVGLNRVWWNLRGEPTAQARIHMKPLYADWVKVPSEGLPAPSVGRISRLEPPGTYTVQLIVGDDAFAQPLVVLKDPHSAGSETDIRAQDAFVRALQSDMNAAVDLINQLELMRSQVASLRLVLQGDQSAADVRAAADSLADKLTAVEGKLHQLKITGRGQDVIRWPAMLSEKIAYLAGGIDDADFPPTSQQLEVKELLEQELTAVQHEFQQVVSADVAAFNALLEQKGLAGVVVHKP